MDPFGKFLMLGVGILFILLIITNQGLPASCANDTKTCPNGSIVTRDIYLNCSFPACMYEEYLVYCDEGVIIQKSGSIIRALSNESFTVYEGDQIINCPSFNPAELTHDCRYYLQLNWSTIINCE